MPLRCVSLILAFALAGICGSGPSVHIIRFADAAPFHMGAVTSMRLVSPAAGAKGLTLNYSESQVGREFSQHVHDHSDDTIMVLAGAAVLRQGNTRTPIPAGTCAWVPTGQIHGTVTTENNTIMISTQTPPDLVLYTGARDSSKPGAPPPQGIITPGAVKYIHFADKNGFFVDPGMGARRDAVARRILKKGEVLRADIHGEQLFFVWKGAAIAKVGPEAQKAGEKDTVFAAGSGVMELVGDSDQPSIVFQIEAPPQLKP